MAKLKKPDTIKIWAIDDNENLIKKFGSYRSLNKSIDNNPDYYQILMKCNNGTIHIIMEKIYFEDEEGNTIEKTICYSDKVKF